MMSHNCRGRYDVRGIRALSRK